MSLITKGHASFLSIVFNYCCSVGNNRTLQFFTTTQNTSTTVKDEYTGSLTASTETLCAQNILTEDNFFYHNKI